MSRIRQVGIKGTLSAGIDEDDTSISSVGLEDLAEVAGGDVAVLVLDPRGIGGAPEVVYVTAHTADADSATVSRGEEQDFGGSAGRSHDSGTAWVHAATPSDFTPPVVVHEYETVSDAALFSTSSTTHADVDATNAVIEVTYPPSGEVLIEVSLIGANTTANNYLALSLRNASGTIAGTDQRVSYATTWIRANYMKKITGTPGATETIKLGAAASPGGTASIFTGPLYGPIVMKATPIGV